MTFLVDILKLKLVEPKIKAKTPKNHFNKQFNQKYMMREFLWVFLDEWN